MFTGFLSRLDAFVNSFTGLGGPNDKTSGASVAPVEVLSFQSCEDLYRGNGYAGAIVDRLASAAVRRGWDVTGEGIDPVALARHEQRLRIRPKFDEALKLGRGFGGSLILPMTWAGKSPIPAEVWRTPLDLDAIDELRFLQVVVCRREANPESYVADWDSEQVGRPLLWQVQPSGASQVRSIHYTRCLYFGGQRLTREGFRRQGHDDSVIQRCYDAIRALSLDDQTLANLGQDLSTDIVKIHDLKKLMTGADAAGLRERLRAMAMGKAATGMIVLDKEDDFETRSKPLGGIGDIANQHRSSLSAGADTPAVLMYGDAPAGFNTDGDSWKTRWSATVHDCQENEVRPQLEAMYRILFASKLGPTGGKVPEFTLTFRPIEEPTNKDLAEIRRVYAAIDQSYIQAGVYDRDHVRASRFGATGWSPEIKSPAPAPSVAPFVQAGTQSAGGANDISRADLPAVP